LDESIEVLRHLIEVAPDYAEGHWNLSVALLASGAYQDGWREFEWRFRKPSPVIERPFHQPRWDGAPLEGKTILLHAEQGFGDTIQFVRYVQLVAARGGRVIIECQVAALRELLRFVAGVAEVVIAGEALPCFDYHLPLMSLPLLFGTTLDTIPDRVPYLSAPSDKIKQWRNLLGTSVKKRVGLVWYAKQSQVLNRKRSCPLRMFAPLWSVPGIEFYTLQIGVGTDQLEEFSSEFEIVDLTAHINDFADTAAFMANLDLVITIDTAVAHLAGALGVKTWVVLPHVAEWRWLCKRSDSAWYPTMRLFRQPSPGDWASLMEDVTVALHSLKRNMRSTEILSTTHSRPLVGLAWTGRQDNPLNCKRSCPFTALMPLFDLENITFVSLQMDPAGNQTPGLIDLTGEIRDFEDTAALMAHLDLVISIDTSVAHLAAATGRPTWVLLSHVADWRWSSGLECSPWYPDVKLFRQPVHGDWDSVIQEVAFRLGQNIVNRLDWQTGDASVIACTRCSGERDALELLLETKRDALRQNAGNPDTHLDIGATLALLGRHAEAITAFRNVLQLNPGHIAGHLNLAYSLLAMGEYSEAWQHFEWRLKRISPGQLPPWPMLQRNDLDSHNVGSRLLVHCEQGYGDTIMFSRFLPLLADAGYQVIVSCQPPLARLVSSLRGVSRVVIHGTPLPVCDYQILMLSLPWLFDSTQETLPVSIPYLIPGKQKITQWHDIVAGRKF
jgi:hypothetical protein